MIFINRNVKKILNIFLISNLLSFIGLSIIPAKSSKENLIFLFLINLIFIFTTVLFSVITYKLLKKKKVKQPKGISRETLNKNINLLIFFSNIGIIFLLYDRIILRKINYLNGLRYARYEWLASTGGNIVGILGNLMIHFGYVLIFFMIIFYEKINPSKIKWIIFSCIVSIVGHATLNGGRSNLLLALVMIIIARSLRGRIRWKKPIRTKLLFFVIFLFSLAFIFIIILSSAKIGGINMNNLLQLGIKSLYGHPDQLWFQNKKPLIIYLIVYTLTYLYHGHWTTQIIYTLDEKNGTYLFYTLGIILNKLKLINTPLESGYFSKTGAFVSLVGTFYYELNFIGVIIFSVIFGILLGIVFLILTTGKKISGIKIAYIIYILYIMILSPILPAYGLMYLNFIIFSFIMLDIINKIILKNNLNFLE